MLYGRRHKLLQFVCCCVTGPQAELCLLPAFLELLALLPGYHLYIHMIGPDVPQQLHGKACRTLAQESTENSGGYTVCICTAEHNGTSPDSVGHTAVAGAPAALGPRCMLALYL